jgi:hypothetical protein
MAPAEPLFSWAEFGVVSKGGEASPERWKIVVCENTWTKIGQSSIRVTVAVEFDVHVEGCYACERSAAACSLTKWGIQGGGAIWIGCLGSWIGSEVE